MATEKTSIPKCIARPFPAVGGDELSSALAWSYEHSESDNGTI